MLDEDVNADAPTVSSFESKGYLFWEDTKERISGRHKAIVCCCGSPICLALPHQNIVLSSNTPVTDESLVNCRTDLSAICDIDRL